MSGDTTDQDSESPKMALQNKGDGGLQPNIESNELAVLAHNHVAERLIILIDSLFEMVSFRGRGCSIGSSLDAAKLLLSLAGIDTAELAKAAPGGTTINTSGPTQIHAASKGGPDRLTQELIDIVSKGNNGKGKAT